MQPVDAEILEVLSRVAAGATKFSSKAPEVYHGDAERCEWKAFQQLVEAILRAEKRGLLTLRLKPHPSGRAVGYDLVIVRSLTLDGNRALEEGRKQAEQTNHATPQNDKGKKRVGRRSKDDTEAGRAAYFAALNKHPTLQDDPNALANETGFSVSTMRRWLAKDQDKFRQSTAANVPADEE